MRKRPSRPARFAAVDNEAVDTIPSVMAVGLITILIRAKDGDDVTVELISQERTEGRESVTKAMRILVEGAYVVKFKIQRATTETVTNDDGSEEVKRGGSWWTTFTVDSIPFTAEDVAAMLADILNTTNAKAVRVEPTWLDPRKNSAVASLVARCRPTNGKPSVGATRQNAKSEPATEGENPGNSGARPTDGFPTVGRPTVGEAAALYRKETSSSLSGEGDADSAEPAEETGEEREEPAAKGNDTSEQHTADAAALQVLSAYEEAKGGKAVNGTRKNILAAAEELLAGGRPLSWLIDRARELPRYGTDLLKHAEMSKVPFTTKAARKAPTAREALGLDDPAYVPVQRDMGALKAMLASKAGI